MLLYSCQNLTYIAKKLHNKYLCFSYLRTNVLHNICSFITLNIFDNFSNYNKAFKNTNSFMLIT